MFNHTMELVVKGPIHTKKLVVEAPIMEKMRFCCTMEDNCKYVTQELVLENAIKIVSKHSHYAHGQVLEWEGLKFSMLMQMYLSSMRIRLKKVVEQGAMVLAILIKAVIRWRSWASW